MQRLALAGHYGQRVELDLCRSCDLVWFDGIETAQLSGPALLELIGAMAAARALPHEMLRADARCPRCAGALKIVHNQSRWGRSLQLQCARRHGAYQSFAQFLEEKGLLRPMSRDRSRQAAARPRPDRLRQLRRRDRQGRRALPLLPLDPEPARRRPPRARARPARHDRAAGRLPGRGAAGRAAMRGLRRGAAPGRDDELLAVRRDARDHQPGRGQRAGAGARAGAARGRGAAVGRGRQAPPRRARRRPAAPARVGGGDAGRSRRAARRSVDEIDWDSRSALDRRRARVLAIALVVWVALALWLLWTARARDSARAALRDRRA